MRTHIIALTLFGLLYIFGSETYETEYRSYQVNAWKAEAYDRMQVNIAEVSKSPGFALPVEGK